MSDKLRAAAKRVADLIEHDNRYCAFAAGILKDALAEPEEKLLSIDRLDQWLKASLAESTVKDSLIVQRPWVGLTDEEIDAIYLQHHNQYDQCQSPNWSYERAVEAKLKDKNGG